MGLVGATLGALFLARRMIIPIRAMREGAARIGAGDLDGRLDIRTGDELEALAQQFNQMAANLRTSYAELEHKVEDRTAELSEALDQQTATREQLAESNGKLEALSVQLSKYLSPQIYDSIFSGRQTAEITAKRKKLTVFFSDIADFTLTTDSMESEELTNLLNHYLTEMSAIALAHGATIDKYVGDAILIFFGDPESHGAREDALRCVKMAIVMQRRMSELQDEWRKLGIEKPFHLRVGINTGFCTVGNFGSVERMDYTIIGNEVNLAARLQSSADLGGILIGHETYSLVRDVVPVEECPEITVKGFGNPIANYRVLDIHGDAEADTSVVRHQRPGAQIDIDLRRLSPEDRSEIAKVVEELGRKLSDVR